MGYNFNVVETDENNRKRIQAQCDQCNEVSFVRRDWATSKVRKNGIQSKYYCAKCTSQKNILIAREKKMDLELIREFIALCEAIFLNLLDDKHENFIGKQLGVKPKAYGLVRDARDFVHEYLTTGVDDMVYDCAEHIEAGSDEEIINLYPWHVELKAHALLALERLPRPEGLI